MTTTNAPPASVVPINEEMARAAPARSGGW